MDKTDLRYDSCDCRDFYVDEGTGGKGCPEWWMEKILVIFSS